MVVWGSKDVQISAGKRAKGSSATSPQHFIQRQSQTSTQGSKWRTETLSTAGRSTEYLVNDFKTTIYLVLFKLKGFNYKYVVYF